MKRVGLILYVMYYKSFNGVWTEKINFHRDEKRVCIYNVYYGITDSVLLLSEQNKESCYTISERVGRKRNTIPS